MTIDLHTLSGAFALDALTDGEADEFTRHLGECEACRDEVREFQAVAARMAAVEASAPPPALRARVLAAADRQAQLPPVVTRLDEARSRHWWTTGGAVAAAVALLVGTVFGIKALQGEQPGQQPPAVALSPVQKVFKAPDARTATIRARNGGRVQVATSNEVGQVALLTSQLPALKGRVYQAWTLRVVDGKARYVVSKGVISDVREGTVFGLPPAGRAVAVSVEPMGGSKKPSTLPIVVVDPQKV